MFTGHYLNVFSACSVTVMHRSISNFFKLLFQAVKNVLSMSEKEISKQNNVEKFEIREQNKNKTEAKWKYKVRSLQLTRFVMISN